MNPYVAAAVRKQQALRALRLPSAQASDHPDGTAPADFLEGMGGGGPKAGMIRSIVCTAAARRMTAEEIASTRAHLAAQREREAAKYRALGVPPVIIENCLRPGPADKVLDREEARRA